MESKTFKKIINDLLVTKGFSRKGSYYYLPFPEIIIVIGLQRSTFSNGYYINIGYIISKLNPELINPRDVDGDIRARFSLEREKKRVDCFDLDQFFEDDGSVLRRHIEENIKQYVEPVSSLEKLKNLLHSKPLMLYQTKLVAKQLLGFE